MMVGRFAVWANPLNLGTVPFRRLGEVIASLRESDQDQIIRAIDEIISRA